MTMSTCEYPPCPYFPMCVRKYTDYSFIFILFYFIFRYHILCCAYGDGTLIPYTHFKTSL